jgi:hypothetical protein
MVEQRLVSSLLSLLASSSSFSCYPEETIRARNHLVLPFFLHLYRRHCHHPGEVRRGRAELRPHHLRHLHFCSLRALLWLTLLPILEKDSQPPHSLEYFFCFLTHMKTGKGHGKYNQK